MSTGPTIPTLSKGTRMGIRSIFSSQRTANPEWRAKTEKNQFNSYHPASTVDNGEGIGKRCSKKRRDNCWALEILEETLDPPIDPTISCSSSVDQIGILGYK